MITIPDERLKLAVNQKIKDLKGITEPGLMLDLTEEDLLQ